MKKYGMSGPAKRSNESVAAKGKLKPMDPKATAMAPSGERAPRPCVMQQDKCYDGMAKTGKK
jgi:hypothetical protein